MSDWVWVPFEVDRKFDGLRVDRFLSQRLTAYSRARVQRMLVDARILRNDRPLKASTKVRGGDRLLIAYPRHPEKPLPENLTLPVLYEDDVLIVIDKPANMLSHPTDKIVQNTVLAVLRKTRLDLARVHLLHRLDRETSGVLALAKSAPAARAWTKNMEARRIKKDYIALVQGAPSPRQGVIDRPIGRQGGVIKVRQWVDVPDAVPAITRYEIISRITPGNGDHDASVVRAYPETGRLHQIRVHLASIGHPLLGDALYQGDGEVYLKMTRHEATANDRITLGFPRLALHAAGIDFPHPLSGRRTRIRAPLPADLRDYLGARRVGKIDTLCSR